jgi:hypothetical protein
MPDNRFLQFDHRRGDRRSDSQSWSDNPGQPRPGNQSNSRARKAPGLLHLLPLDGYHSRTSSSNFAGKLCSASRKIIERQPDCHSGSFKVTPHPTAFPTNPSPRPSPRRTGRGRSQAAQRVDCCARGRVRSYPEPLAARAELQSSLGGGTSDFRSSKSALVM